MTSGWSRRGRPVWKWRRHLICWLGAAQPPLPSALVTHPQVVRPPLLLLTGNVMTRLYRYLLLLGGLTTTAPTSLWAQSPSLPSKTGAQVEDIYVARALRESRSAPTAFCDQNRIGFGRALFEDQFLLRSIQTRSTDGLVVDADGNTIGNMRVCFGATADSAVLTFHAEGTLAAVDFIGRGECLTVRRDFPEPGITVMRCFLNLGSLPPDYVGGQLTSNTVLSRVAVGGLSDPEGYTQPSIVTVRLWKKR